MLRFLLLSSIVLLFASVAPQRPGPEKTFVHLLKKDQIQEFFANYNDIFVYVSACEELDCDKLPKKVKGKPLLILAKEDLFMRGAPRALYIDDVFDEDGDWGISFHIQGGIGPRARVLFRGTYVR